MGKRKRGGKTQRKKKLQRDVLVEMGEQLTHPLNLDQVNNSNHSPSGLSILLSQANNYDDSPSGLPIPLAQANNSNHSPSGLSILLSQANNYDDSPSGLPVPLAQANNSNHSNSEPAPLAQVNNYDHIPTRLPTPEETIFPSSSKSSEEFYREWVTQSVQPSSPIEFTNEDFEQIFSNDDPISNSNETSPDTATTNMQVSQQQQTIPMPQENMKPDINIQNCQENVESTETSMLTPRNEDMEQSLIEEVFKIPNLPSSIHLSVQSQQRQEQLENTDDQQLDNTDDIGSISNALFKTGVTITIAKNKGAISKRLVKNAWKCNILKIPTTKVNEAILKLHSRVSVVQSPSPPRKKNINQKENPTQIPTIPSKIPMETQWKICHGTKNILYECTICRGIYRTHHSLQQHKEIFHQKSFTSEMAIPLVNYKDLLVSKNLTHLKIQHVIAPPQLDNKASGFLGIPILSIDEIAHDPVIYNLSHLCASNILSLGSTKDIKD